MPPQIATRYGMKPGGGGRPGRYLPTKTIPTCPPPPPRAAHPHQKNSQVPPPPRGYEHLSAPIRHVTFRLRDQRGAASLRHRNRAATTVLAREQKPYPVWRRKSYRVHCEPGGGYFRYFWVGMCRWYPGTLDLY